VHVVDLVSVVVDTYRVPPTPLFNEEYYGIVSYLSMLSEETNIDRRFGVEFIAIARFMGAHCAYSSDIAPHTGQLPAITAMPIRRIVSAPGSVWLQDIVD
jgi:hypothetical protein